MPISMHGTPGGENPRRRRASRGAKIPRRAIPHRPNGNAPIVSHGLNKIRPRSLPHQPIGIIPEIVSEAVPHLAPIRRFVYQIMPLKSQMQVRRVENSARELIEKANTVLGRRQYQSARRYLRQSMMALAHPNPRTFYPPLLKFLNLQENAFTRLAKIREDHVAELKEISKNADTHAQTQKQIAARIDEMQGQIAHLRFVVWDVRTWKRRIESNRRKIGSPHFSKEQFAEDIEKVKQSLDKS